MQWSHLATLRTGFGITRGTAPGGGNVSPGNGHGFISYGGHDTAEPVQVLVDYEEDTREEFEARLGPRATAAESYRGNRVPQFFHDKDQLPFPARLAPQGPQQH